MSPKSSTFAAENENVGLIMKYRICALLLALSTCACVWATGGTCGPNLTWDLTNGVLTISGTGPMTNWTGYSTWDGHGPWYSSRSSIKAIHIGEGVTTVGNSAFPCCGNLSSVTLPSTLTKIGEYAFYQSDKLTSIVFPEGLDTIGMSAFMESGLTSVCLPDSIRYIGTEAFWGCTGVTSISLPNRDVDCGVMVFAFCSNLSSLTIPNRFTVIPREMFEGCSALTSVIIPDSVQEIGIGAFESCHGLTSVTMSNSVTRIGHSAFSGCYALTDIPLSDSLKTIGDNAFEYCYSLTSLTIPANVSSMGESLVKRDTNLTALYILKETPMYYGPVGIGAYLSFRDAPANMMIYVPCGTLQTYEVARGWSNLAGKIAYAPLSVPYSLEIASQDTLLGTVRVLDSFMPTVCDTVDTLPTYTIEAIPNEECSFVQWSDGNTEATRIVVLSQDTSLIAQFAPIGTSFPMYPQDNREQSSSRKELQNGALYILLPNGTRYDATGKKVE